MGSKSNCVVILAGGKGTRMKTSKPKVLCELLFKPMINWVLDAASSAADGDICVVTGHQNELLEAHLKGRYHTVFQSERKGTGHAVMQAKEFISQHTGNVLILNGDSPMMDSETIYQALQYHLEGANDVTVISAKISKPTGYGRIVRDAAGFLKKITEEKDANEKIKKIDEINSGAYWFKIPALLEALEQIDNNNTQGEYYLTDAIGIIIRKGLRAAAFTASSSNIARGANDRVQLLDLNYRARQLTLKTLMLEGVDIPCADGIIIGPDVKIGQDTRILPGTIIYGDVTIGSDCVIGPNSYIVDSQIGDNCSLNNVQCFSSKIESGCAVGPFAHIRPGSLIQNNVRVGNFVEIKNSSIGEKSKVSHLTYVGDTDMGKEVNMGCGTVTVNYDGSKKFRTVIKDKAFIGCNTNLVAPVTVEEGGYTAAGSTITDDVPERSLAIARARQVNKTGWTKNRK